MSVVRSWFENNSRKKFSDGENICPRSIAIKNVLNACSVKIICAASSCFKNGSGFEIYSYSLDDNKAAWQAAIEKDGLYWTYHVSDLDGFGSYVVPLYEFNSLPHNVLIDGDGVILKKDLDVHKLDATLKRYLR